MRQRAVYPRSVRSIAAGLSQFHNPRMAHSLWLLDVAGPFNLWPVARSHMRFRNLTSELLAERVSRLLGLSARGGASNDGGSIGILVTVTQEDRDRLIVEDYERCTRTTVGTIPS